MRAPTAVGLLVVFIAGCFVAALWMFGDAGEASPSPDATAGAPVIEGPTAIVAMTSNLYGAPSKAADLVAIVPEGRLVRVTGRTDDSSWIRVIYPVASTLEGWLPVTNLAEASVPDLAAVPDVASVTGEGTIDGGSGLGEAPALPDLTVSSADVGLNGTISVRITNVGRAAFAGSVGLRLSTAEGEIVGALDLDLESSPLGPGRSASVNTGVVVTQTGLFVIEVDPTNDIDESSEFNNARRVLLVGSGT